MRCDTEFVTRAGCRPYQRFIVTSPGLPPTVLEAPDNEVAELCFRYYLDMMGVGNVNSEYVEDDRHRTHEVHQVEAT